MLSNLTRAGLCCLSVVFIIGGIVSIALARGRVHEHKVEDYQDSVAQWKLASNRFQGMKQVSLSLKGSEASQTMVLKHTTGPNPLASNEDAYELPDYEASWYEAGEADLVGTEKEFLPPATWSNLENISAMARWGQLAYFLLAVDGSSLEIGPVPLVRSMAHYEPEGVYDRCADKEGIHTLSGVCWVYSRLSRLCVQIKEDGDSGWQLARRIPDRNFSYGCTYRGEKGKWEAAEYSTVPIVRKGRFSLAPNESADFEDFTVEVRSAQDPWFQAIELTHGSMSFGMTSLEENVLGIILIVMGGVFCLANITASCAMRRMHDDDPFSPRARQRQRVGKGRADAKQRRRQRELDAETIGMRYAVEPQQEPSIAEEDIAEEEEEVESPARA